MSQAPLQKTGERMLPGLCDSEEEHVLFLRHLFAYELAKSMIPRGVRLLEIGCGAGYGTAAMADWAAEVTGLDVEAQAVAHASAAYAGPNRRFQVYDGRVIPYEDESFDAFISFQVVEHVRDHVRFVSEAHRVLRKGGLGLLTTPNGFLRLRPGQRPWGRFHVREYTAAQFRKLLSTSFADVEVWGVHGTREIHDLEMKEIGRAHLFGRLDPFDLRRMIPQYIKNSLLNWLRRPRTATVVRRFDVKDYRVERGDVGGSLDLVGVCRK